MRTNNEDITEEVKSLMQAYGNNDLAYKEMLIVLADFF